MFKVNACYNEHLSVYVGELVPDGYEIFIECEAGTSSGYADEDYQAVGVHLEPTANDLYNIAELIVTLKEPIERRSSDRSTRSSKTR